MDRKDRILYHQIHPVKLLTDVSAALVSLPMLWRHRLRAALLVHFLPPVVVSVVLVQWAHLEGYPHSPLGRYVARSMTPAMQALRFGGDLVMMVGAWRRRPSLITAGALLILLGWLRGKLPVNRA